MGENCRSSWQICPRGVCAASSLNKHMKALCQTVPPDSGAAELSRQGAGGGTGVNGGMGAGGECWYGTMKMGVGAGAVGAEVQEQHELHRGAAVGTV